MRLVVACRLVVEGNGSTVVAAAQNSEQVVQQIGPKAPSSYQADWLRSIILGGTSGQRCAPDW
jgi:hypothetical protein